MGVHLARGGRRKRRPFVWIAFAAIAGILLGEIAPWSPWVPMGAAILFGAGAIRKPVLVLAMVAALFCAAHQIRHGGARARTSANLLGDEWRVIVVEGTVDSFPEADEWGRLRFRLRAEVLRLGETSMAGPIPLMTRWMQGHADYGDRFRFVARIRNVPRPRNSGEFDYRGFLERKGIWSELEIREGGVTRLARGGGNPLMRMAGVTREWMRSRLKAGIENDAERAALIESMVLGVTEDASPEIAQLFRETGTLHLFAVSGLNVGMFGMIVWAAVSPFGLGRRLTAAWVIPAILFYALVTGLTSSGVRAAVMAAVMLGGIVWDRRADAANGLGFAAFLILGFDGNQLFQAGFQLSFGVVIALMLWAGPMGRALSGWGMPDPFLPKGFVPPWRRVLAGATEKSGRFLGVCSAAWVGSLPLNIFYFQMISPIALVANLIAVPIAFAVLATGMIGVVGGAFSGWIASVFSHSNWLAVGLLLDMMRACTAVPFGHAGIGLPDCSGARATVQLFDFADGGGALIRCGGDAVLIDAGRERDYRRTLTGTLRRSGVRRLSAFFWTHGDVAHLGGAVGVLGEKGVGTVLESGCDDRSITRRKASCAADGQGVPRVRVASGDAWATANGAIRVEVLYPPAGLARSEADDEALVLRVEIGGRRVLLVSDSGFVAERWLLDRGLDLRADLLVKGVHKGDLSGTGEFLRKVHPAVAVLGYDPFAPAHGISGCLLSRFEAMGTRVFRMDRTGEVTIRFFDGRYEARGFLDGSLFTSRDL